MKRRRPRLVGPPILGPISPTGITELVSEEEQAGRPVPPPVVWLTPRPTTEVEITELVSEEEQAGRPVPPPVGRPPE